MKLREIEDKSGAEVGGLNTGGLILFILSQTTQFLDLVRRSLDDHSLVKLTLGKYRGPERELQHIYIRPVVSFLGYMADVLPLLKARRTGFDVL
jgi:hypothetical protein